MAFKFIFALTIIATATSGYAPISPAYHTEPATIALHAAPVGGAQHVVVKSEEYDSHPQYKFSYGVDDKLTGDSKSQMEERDGDVVNGEYSLIDSDGYKRTVHYTSHPVHGFNAVVNREPLSKTVAVAPVAHYAAPAVVKSVSPPVHYSVPTNHYNGPVAHYATPSGHYTSYPAPAVAKYHH